VGKAIAWENFRARFNRGFGMEAEGFTEDAACPLPTAARADGNLRRDAVMTVAQRLLWLAVSVLSVFVLFGLSFVAFSVGRDDWFAFFQSPARVGALVVSLALSALVVFCNFGGMNPGKKEDRSNRWIFGPITVLSLCLALLPAYLDGCGFWVTDKAVTPYVGLVLLTLGGALRLAAVFVLGRRFTGLVAIQEGHRLQTTGLYRYIRHPSYAGMLLYMVGYVLVFRCWLGLLLVAATLALLLARMNAEESLLQNEFGEDYASYRHHTWRLVPWVY
jgi:protein-S-isoprenylcysteine O-methyltransferase Ste14